MEKQIKKIEQSDWSKFKVKCNHFSESDINKLLQLNKNIALDSNGSFTAEECLWLENNELVSQFTYLEQPMKIGVEQYSTLHSDQFANWMADEDLQSMVDLELLQPHYKTLNIKVMKCGGLTPSLAIIQKAKALNFKIMIGCMTESTVGISAGIALASFADYLDLDGANLIANDTFAGSKIVNGEVVLSQKPGLGIQI